MKAKKGRGGARAGAGRKPILPRRKTYSVQITDEHATLLIRWGGGDMSAGIRWLVDEANKLLIKKDDPT